MILKGGKESYHTAIVLSQAIRAALSKTSLPADYIQMVHTQQEVTSLLALDQYIDLVIPRGSNTGPEKGVQWHGKHGGGWDVPKGGRMHGWFTGDGGHAAWFGV